MKSLLLITIFIFTFVLISTSQAYYGPNPIITIQFVGGKYKYTLINIDNNKIHFYILPARTYIYKIKGTPAEDTEWNRKEIILALHRGLINRNYALDIKNMVKMKTKGWCIPTIHVAKQEKGLPTMVIDFQLKAGTIIGFLVADGLPCGQEF